MDSAEPTEPIDRTDPLEQIDSTEPSDQRDKTARGSFGPDMWPRLAGGPESRPVRTNLSGTCSPAEGRTHEQRGKRTDGTAPGGGHIPLLGFGPGSWRYRGLRGTRAALEVGYRHIDTATGYSNEDRVGAALRDSGISGAKSS